MDEEYDVLPAKGSDLSDWRFFAIQAFGIESPMVNYLETLCRQFTPQYEIDMQPGQFLDHLARINHTSTVANLQWNNCEKWLEEH